MTAQTMRAVRWRQRLIGEVPTGVTVAGFIHLLDGKPLFTAFRKHKKRHGRASIIWGEEVLGRYDWVEHLTVGQGRPLYIARNGWEHFVVWGDRVGKSYIGVDRHDLSIRGGQPFYVARRGSKRSLVWGNVEGKTHDWIGDVALLDGKPALCVGRGEKFHERTRLVWGDHQSREYGWVESPVLADGKLLHVAGTDIGRQKFLVLGGEEIPPYYDKIEHLAWVDGEPLFVAEFGRVGGPQKQAFVVHGNERGKAYRGGFSPIHSFSLVGGTPLYAAEDGDRKVVVLGETEFTIPDPRNHRIGFKMAVLRDKPLYVAERGYLRDQQAVLCHGEDELGVYGSVACLQVHQDQPLFIAQSGQQACVVWGAAGSRLYDKVDFLSLRPEGDHIAFIAFRGREIYRVTGHVVNTTDTARHP